MRGRLRRLKQHVGLEAEYERVAYGGYAAGLDEILNLGLQLNARQIEKL